MMPSHSNPRKVEVRNRMLSIAFLISLAIHIAVILSASALIREHDSRQERLLLVKLIDRPSQPPSPPAPPYRLAGLAPLKRMPPPAPLQLNEPKKPAAPATTSAAKPEPSRASLPSSHQSAHVETATSLASTAGFELSGGESGGRNLSIRGNGGIIPGQDNPDTGAASGDYGAGAAGSPAQSAHR